MKTVCRTGLRSETSDHFGSLFSSLALKVDSACYFRNVYGPSVRDPFAERVAFFARSLEIELRSYGLSGRPLYLLVISYSEGSR